MNIADNDVMKTFYYILDLTQGYSPCGLCARFVTLSLLALSNTVNCSMHFLTVNPVLNTAFEDCSFMPHYLKGSGGDLEACFKKSLPAVVRSEIDSYLDKPAFVDITGFRYVPSWSPLLVFLQQKALVALNNEWKTIEVKEGDDIEEILLNKKLLIKV